MKLWYVHSIVILVITWLSIGTVQSGNYNPREYQIVMFTWEYHGYDCTVCLDDMTFTRGAGKNAGQVCRLVLPERLREGI